MRSFMILIVLFVVAGLSGCGGGGGSGAGTGTGAAGGGVKGVAR